MLVEFSVGNYRSFKEPVTLSMVAANLVSKDKALDENNVVAVDNELKLLKSAAIYGPNAGGKSNLAKALNFMRWFMINSSRETQSTDSINVDPFLLSGDIEGQPSYFEIVFIMEGIQYRYGFEATGAEIVSEWLFYVPKVREARLFKRGQEEIRSSRKLDAEGVQKRTRHNALFLSVCAQFNVSLAERILKWVEEKLYIVSGLHDDYLSHTLDCLLENKGRDKVISLMRKLDLGIEGIQVQHQEIPINSSTVLSPDIPEEIREAISEHGIENVNSLGTVHAGTLHSVQNEDGTQSTKVFNIRTHESEGTQKLFSLAGLLLKTLEEGNVLIVDELDARLHPLITLAIVELFHSNKTNASNAQLLFMTHDTNLLSNDLFRRDQIWFTEKNQYGATDLYSLAEYRSVRNDAAYESNYIKGRYGAIPFVGNLQNLIGTNG